MFERISGKKRRSLLLLLGLSVVSFAAGSVEAANVANYVANGGFEQGLTGWKPFRDKDPKARISLSTDAYKGKHSVKVETTGETTHEGIRTRVKEMEPENLYVISVYAKGSGVCRLFAYDGKWTYGPRNKLTAQWRRLEIQKSVAGKDISLHIVSDTSYDKGPAVFYVDEVQVTKSEAKPLTSTEVYPVVYEAEELVPPSDKNVQIVKDVSASGGSYACAQIRWVYMARDVPCPQTTRPLYVYVKAWTSDHKVNKLSILSMQTVHGTISLPESNRWMWARCAKPQSVRRIGERFYLTVSSEKKRVQNRLDVLVLTTQSNLTPEKLEAIVAKRRTPPDKGMVTIAATSTPPVIDGAPGDACWHGAVEAAPFAMRGMRKRGKTAFSKEQTNAYLCYDADNLYVCFRCFQSVLDPMNNQLGAFRKSVTGHDLEAIWRDDYVLVMLDTDLDGKGFFNIMVNGNGSTLDERCPPEAPWRKRDKAWESGAEVKAKIADGEWVVEARIPFKNLGVMPEEGDRWGVCLGRMNQRPDAAREPTTWQPMEGGYHNAAEFGLLEFGSRVPGVRLLNLPELRPGENTIKFKIRNPAPEPTNVRVGVETVDERGEINREFTDYSFRAGEVKDVAFTHAVAAEGRLHFRYFVENPADLSRCYQSPRYLVRVQSSTLVMNVRSDQPYTLFVNGQAIALGAKGANTHTHPLYRGINAIAIETADPGIKVSCNVGRETFGLDRTWRFAARSTEGWNSSGFDDGTWARWERTPPTGKTIYLRKNLLFKHSKIWPPNGGIHVAVGTVTAFWHWLDGIKGRTLTGYKFCLELPEGVELAGATGFDYVKDYGNTIRDIQESDTLRNNRTYRKYTLTFVKPVHALSTRRMSRSYSHCYVGVVATRDLGKDPMIYYYVATDRFAEIANSEKIVVYPPLNCRTPKRHTFICWGGTEMYGHSASLEEAVVKAMSRCGFTHYTCKRNLADRYGLKVFRPGAEWPTGLMAISSKFPDLQRYDEDSNRITPTGWCPSLLMNDRVVAFLKRTYAGGYAKQRYDIVDWDLECNPYQGRAACFCRECLARFKKSAGLPKDVKLNRETIRSKYKDRWLDFMCRQTELTARVLREVIKEQNSRTVFSVYSGYQSPLNRAHYSMVWPLIAPHIDSASCGYGRRPKEIKATLAALAPYKVPLLGGILIDCPYESMEPPHPNQTRKVEVIRRVLDCRGGVFFMTPTRGMDARAYTSFAEVTRFVSDCEEFLVEREYDTALVVGKNIPDDNIAVLRKGKRTLILLLNDGSWEMKVALKLKKSFNRIEDYYDNGKVRAGESPALHATVPPYDFVALICD